MGQHYLSILFSPKSVAVIGASERADSVGQIVFKNMLESGYQGALYPVNPAHQEVQGKRAYASIEEIGAPVELAVICTEAETVPDIIEACGKHGVRAAVVLSAGFSEVGAHGAALEHAMLANANRYGMRLIGPNCLGIMRPAIGLNATSSTRAAPRPATSLWCRNPARSAPPFWTGRTANDVGFSSVVSMGSSADVDFGEILDYLAYRHADPEASCSTSKASATRAAS